MLLAACKLVQFTVMNYQTPVEECAGVNRSKNRLVVIPAGFFKPKMVETYFQATIY